VFGYVVFCKSKKKNKWGEERDCQVLIQFKIANKTFISNLIHHQAKGIVHDIFFIPLLFPL
jgi:hypothetical protein